MTASRAKWASALTAIALISALVAPKFADAFSHGIATAPTNGLTIIASFDPTNTGTRAAPGTAFGNTVSATSNQFFDRVDAAIALFQTKFIPPRSVTIHIEFNYAEFIWNGVDGGPITAGTSAYSSFHSYDNAGPFSYSNVATALAANANSANATSAASHLNPRPIPGELVISQAHALVLGLSPAAAVTGVTNASTATSSGTLHFAAGTIPTAIAAGMTIRDVTTGNLFIGKISDYNNATGTMTLPVFVNVASAVGSGDTLSFQYEFDSPTLGSIAIGSGADDGTILHELSEILGRVGFNGQGVTFGGNSYARYSTYDLLSFKSSDGTPATIQGNISAYFSVDGGTTHLATFRDASGGGDSRDWDGSDPTDACNAVVGGTVFTTVDKKALDALGYRWNGTYLLKRDLDPVANDNSPAFLDRAA